MKTLKKWYALSWSPKSGKATYTRGFWTEAERDQFISRIRAISISIHTWTNEYLIEAE